MGKKRKHDDEEVPFVNGKKIKEDLDETRNGNFDTTINGVSSSHEVFLIRKPVSVSLAELRKLKFTLDSEVLAKKKLKTEAGTFRINVNSSSKKRLVHIPAKKELTLEDSRNVRAECFVAGSISIVPLEPKEKHLGGKIIDEENDEAVDPEHLASLPLKPIKKVAKLEMDGLKQRNKAYGLETNLDGSERRLNNLLPKYED